MVRYSIIQTPKTLKRDSKRDFRKDPSKFTLNLSETKMKTAYPENENSVSWKWKQRILVSGGTKFIDTDPRDLSEWDKSRNNQTASRQKPNSV
jgi:hypothetical protein